MDTPTQTLELEIRVIRGVLDQLIENRTPDKEETIIGLETQIKEYEKAIEKINENKIQPQVQETN